jgi:hypothetical protein
MPRRPFGQANGFCRGISERRKGKRIAVPVRIEPKVYFASERTFLVRPYLSKTRTLTWG